MANMMAFPELRHPFESTPLHEHGQATVIYNGKSVNVQEGGAQDALLINPTDLSLVNGFEIKPEGGGRCQIVQIIPNLGEPLLRGFSGEMIPKI